VGPKLDRGGPIYSSACWTFLWNHDPWAKPYGPHTPFSPFESLHLSLLPLFSFVVVSPGRMTRSS
jgi:hypothetical protein